jgi:hypothetical protein
MTVLYVNFCLLLLGHETFLSSSLAELVYLLVQLARSFEDVLLMTVDGGYQSLCNILQILVL